MSSEPSWNCPWTERCERSKATGSMPPDLRRRTHVRRTSSSSAELQCRPEQTTESDLQQQSSGPVPASLCTSSDTVWTGCVVSQAANAADHESRRASIDNCMPPALWPVSQICRISLDRPLESWCNINSCNEQWGEHANLITSFVPMRSWT